MTTMPLAATDKLRVEKTDKLFAKALKDLEPAEAREQALAAAKQLVRAICELVPEENDRDSVIAEFEDVARALFAVGTDET